MKTAANLYKQHKSDTHSTWRPEAQSPRDEELEAIKRKNKEEARKAKAEAERLKREVKKKRENAGKPKPKRKPFNFEEVIACSLTVSPRGLAESMFVGETKDPHPNRGCDPVCEQPRQCHHCKPSGDVDLSLSLVALIMYGSW